MTALLAMEKVSHSFGGLKALNDVSLRLDPGQIHGVIGPNGAGKTTVFNVITGIYSPSHGSIRYKETELRGLSTSAINRMGLARTFQNIRLFKSMTVFDNIRVAGAARQNYGPLGAMLRLPAFGREESRMTGEIKQLLDQFGLSHLASEPVGSLPYGIQRRVEMARAMATHPTVLLLDEPAAGINPQEVTALIDFIGWLRNSFDLSIVLIEHHMNLVMKLCDTITVLDFGAVIAEGRPAAIQANPRVLEAYLGVEEAATP